MQSIDQEELFRVTGGMASPQMNPQPGGGSVAGTNHNPSSAPAGPAKATIGGGAMSGGPGSFTAHYPGGGGRP